MDKLDQWADKREKQVIKNWRDQNGYTWKTDIKTYIDLVMHPKKAVSLVYDFYEYRQMALDRILDEIHKRDMAKAMRTYEAQKNGEKI